MIILLLFLLTPSQQLIDVGNVQSIKTGKIHPVLQQLAEEHAAYQAKIKKQGHQNWNKRYQILRKQIVDCDEFYEVANESWPNQNQVDAAKEMYRSWKQSKGHWKAVNSPCKYYGYAMVKGRNNIWYACAIFAR